ncbi:Ltp family lipoprotein [Paeniglutamicibacter psychrophenolicus]|uniref:Ltp family lipoprotein n=1 Tax=Paeniglutamicibacter psychrophenolicus TaxID=257454 RepID=UPI00278B7EC5|nr:Ltp family lipoprotein [Paeniglutamicibacter psychrophenolicus]MDQ0094828.1 hypothetical protein [Paeniglutamicibacter psychrophenolicus]
MSVRFNPPPLWRQYLPADFTPTPSWIPESTWGAPPAGWPLWVDNGTGHPAMPPAEFSTNPYLYLSVMPGTPSPGAIPSPASGSSGFGPSVSGFSAPAPQKPKKPLSRGKKIGIGVVGLVGLSFIVGSCGGIGDPSSSAPETTAAAVASPSATQAAEVDAVSPEAEASAKAEAEARAKAEAEASAKAKDDAKAAAKAEAEASAKAEAEANAKAKEEAKAEAAASAKAEAEAGTVSQQNALRAAENYLDYTAFSRKGLISQLKFEDYSTKDATWAVERVKVNWNEQAAKAAENYLDYTAFSRNGLIEQLIFEGYTRKQAEFGVSKTGL